MSFSKALLLIIAGGLLGFVFSVSLGDRVAGRLSRVPILKNYRIVSTQAPIVIHTTEEVRSRGDEDILSALERSRQKVSAVLQKTEQGFVYVGGAINLTSDGWFMTSKDLVEKKGSAYIQLPDGSLRQVSQVFVDTASGLGFMQAAGSGSLSVAGFGNSVELRSGERVLLVTAGVGNENPRSRVSFVLQKEMRSKDAEAGFYNNRFEIQASGNIEAGTAIVNMTGDVVGVWNGSFVVPSSTLSLVSDMFIANKSSIKRPVYGFAYYAYSSFESESAELPQGSVSVLRVAQNSPSFQVGLKVGDVITAVNGQKLSDIQNLDALFISQIQGSALNMTVFRSGKEVDLKVTPTFQ